jgi:hypothetical protein
LKYCWHISDTFPLNIWAKSRKFSPFLHLKGKWEIYIWGTLCMLALQNKVHNARQSKPAIRINIVPPPPNITEV